MQKTHQYPNRLTLTVRTEGGAASIDVGLQGLSREERALLFRIVRDTAKGGECGFGLAPNAEGDAVISITLRCLKPEKREPVMIEGTAAA